MNLNNLKENHEVLIAHMKKNNYSTRYITAFKRELRELFEKATEDETYLEYYERVIKPKSECLPRDSRKEILTRIIDFDLNGNFPNRTKIKYKLVDNSNYSKLCDEYKNIINTFEDITKNILSKKTIHHYSLLTAIFLIYLQNKGITCINNITEKDVLSFFLYENKVIYCSYKNPLKSVFEACAPYIDGLEKILNYLPKYRRHKKNIQVLKKEEIKEIKEAIEKSTFSCLRDKAIMLLLFYTGLRACDIVNLKLSNIDWINETINIVQIKTKQSLELPLLTPVGNALYEYITKERIKTNLSNVFIRLDANLPLEPGSINNIVNKFMNSINIRMNKNDRRGPHLFRHNLAISLLENEVPQPIISETLGHISPESIESYLDTDFTHLRKCALSIEPFNCKEVN